MVIWAFVTIMFYHLLRILTEARFVVFLLLGEFLDALFRLYSTKRYRSKIHGHFAAVTFGCGRKNSSGLIEICHGIKSKRLILDFGILHPQIPTVQNRRPNLSSYKYRL